MTPISREYRAEIISDVARKIGTQPQWLDALINFETGGSYDPQKKNPVSSARGLIQFIDASAKDLGYNSSLELVQDLPYFKEQMYGAVLPYFQMRKKQYGPLNTQQKLYMSVFFPPAIKYPPSTTFEKIYQDVYGSKWKTEYAKYVRGNPNIKKVSDYINYVNARIEKSALHEFPKAFPALAIAAGAGVLLWLYFKTS